NLPLTAGGVSTCVSNQITGTITGTANIESGSAATTVNLISRVATGPNPNPCPKCVGDATANDGVRGGTCDVGPNAGLTCDINGTSPNLFWGSTSLDCPIDPASVVASLPVNLTNSTGTQTRTVTAASPNCTTSGYGAFKCLCDTCNNLTGQSCSSNADCPVSGRCAGGTNAGAACTVASECAGGGTCSGKPCGAGTECPSGVCTGGLCSTTDGICGSSSGARCIGSSNPGAPCQGIAFGTQCPGGSCGLPGQATLFNQCADGVCSPTSTCVGGTNPNANCSSASECPGGTCAAGNEGECAGGPSEQFCGPNATFTGCSSDANSPPANARVGGTNVGAACSVASECSGGGVRQWKVGGPGVQEKCVIAKFRDCFLDNGTIGNTVNATGAVSTPVNDQSTPTLASLFCVGPT